MKVELIKTQSIDNVRKATVEKEGKTLQQLLDHWKDPDLVKSIVRECIMHGSYEKHPSSDATKHYLFFALSKVAQSEERKQSCKTQLAQESQMTAQSQQLFADISRALGDGDVSFCILVHLYHGLHSVEHKST